MNQTKDPYEGIDEACPSCGMKSVWICSHTNCPKKDHQRRARDAWYDRMKAPPE